MDWFRKHWADALLILAVLLVVSGLVLTLLSGINFNPLELVGLGDPAPATTRPATVTTTPTTPSAPAANAGIAPLPPTIGATPAPAAPAPTTTAPVTPTPTPAPAVTTATPGGAFRIAAGAFSRVANAEALAARLRTAGYTVTLEPAGSLTGVFVGPYATRTAADAAAEAIRQAEQVDTLVLATGAAPAPATAVTPAAPAPGQVFMQVLAVRSQTSADEVVAALTRQGFQAQRRGPGTDGLHRVVVGPVAESEVAALRDRLRDAGYPDAYPVR